MSGTKDGLRHEKGSCTRNSGLGGNVCPGVCGCGSHDHDHDDEAKARVKRIKVSEPATTSPTTPESADSGTIISRGG